ncbi:hypothetical protein GobsT_53110 [Gemmata obscuriglobus]|uniref:Uncharacterized protein n=1 Tax=Gemmata obscuriglobus TaxID=114 RepID=A0A2Z3H130_9BACT|nr:hypothetical protein [Gemmata obscuriglobus]AWM36825.1 hypothetical protein C1280_07210 [Gemmata obscuriglobus]QEG30506.1 hypothetical protein GobsT_53110 [Gemmata obscuriglobus]VTS09830.1 Uncharacterized protein OS=Singulisphaera acidiphila (strain ATCC BAA-1392 / DSM 18658 / VKM B-2454 / MOB10) GN=Sinac_6736 PE=4 SV=1 [Gemmata obscuriglobus UQM 2246]
MPMSPYPVLCYAPGCHSPALYKIAAKWSDGTTAELKTYGLACAACVPKLLDRAREKRTACRLAVGETLELPGVYDLTRGERDRVLARRPDLEPPPGVQ